jgi:hypothetical protein
MLLRKRDINKPWVVGFAKGKSGTENKSVCLDENIIITMSHLDPRTVFLLSLRPLELPDP